MFCPECGTLGFMESVEISDALTTRAGTKGPNGKRWQRAEFTDPATGETIDLSKADLLERRRISNI